MAFFWHLAFLPKPLIEGFLRYICWIHTYSIIYIYIFLNWYTQNTCVLMIYYKMIHIFDIYSFEWGGKLLTKGVLLLDKRREFLTILGWSAGGGIFPMVILDNDICRPRHLQLTWSCLECFLSVCLDLFSKWFEDPPQHPKKNGLAIGRVLVIQMIVWINRQFCHKDDKDTESERWESSKRSKF